MMDWRQEVWGRYGGMRYVGIHKTVRALGIPEVCKRINFGPPACSSMSGCQFCVETVTEYSAIFLIIASSLDSTVAVVANWHAHWRRAGGLPSSPRPA